jgi:hypothetical protein
VRHFFGKCNASSEEKRMENLSMTQCKIYKNSGRFIRISLPWKKRLPTTQKITHKI